MNIKRHKKCVVSAILLICLISIWMVGSLEGGERKGQTETEITLPELKSDTALAIDAYERIMNRLLGMTERNFEEVNNDIRYIAEKMNSIDNKLTELSMRMERIEKALNIEKMENKPQDPCKAENLQNSKTNLNQKSTSH